MLPEVAKRLLDALQACVAIENFVKDVDFPHFAESGLIRAAVERQFEIIGEALGKAARDEPQLGVRIPDIPRVVGLRNRLIHGYDSVDEQIIWDIVITKLPGLRTALRAELQRAGYSLDTDRG